MDNERELLGFVTAILLVLPALPLRDFAWISYIKLCKSNDYVNILLIRLDI